MWIYYYPNAYLYEAGLRHLNGRPSGMSVVSRFTPKTPEKVALTGHMYHSVNYYLMQYVLHLIILYKPLLSEM